MAKCPNCGTAYSCGCKKRTASDGKQCCATCISTYETSIKPKSGGTMTPTNVKSSGTLQGL
jgi:hypothetical protein